MQKRDGQPEEVTDLEEKENSLLSGQVEAGAIGKDLTELKLNLLKVGSCLDPRRPLTLIAIYSSEGHLTFSLDIKGIMIFCELESMQEYLIGNLLQK